MRITLMLFLSYLHFYVKARRTGIISLPVLHWLSVPGLHNQNHCYTSRHPAKKTDCLRQSVFSMCVYGVCCVYLDFYYFRMESASFLASAVSSLILSNAPAFTRSPLTIQLPPQQRILSQERYSSRFAALIPPVGINRIPV